MEMKNAPWLNKDNLEEWLGTPVLELIVKEAELKGDNYLSNMYRLQVKTKNGTKALIVKCRLEDTEAAVALKETNIFKKEAEMYGNTLPRLYKILKKATNDDCEPLAPKCLYSCNDFLVMEDLSADGYKMLDRCRGLDLEQCQNVMRTIARFHAASVVLHEQDPQSVKVYEDSFFCEPSLVNSWVVYFKTMTKTLIEEIETWPAAQWGQYVEKLRHIQDDFVERLLKICHRNDSEFNVLIHGDLWTNNILFRDEAVRLLDFQLVHFTSPAIDLIMFLTSSPNMEVRINHTDRLIQEYHTSLCSTLASLGYKKLPTLDEIHQKYRSKAFYGVYGVVSEAAIMTADPSCGFNLDEAMKGNVPGPQIYSELFKKIVQWEFPILDRMGAFD